jgi:hypothetical protein
MWGVEMTLQNVTFYHYSKDLIKNIALGLVKNTTLRLVKKAILVILDLLKLTCPKKPNWFFDPLSLWGNFSFENPV